MDDRNTQKSKEEKQASGEIQCTEWEYTVYPPGPPKECWMMHFFFFLSFALLLTWSISWKCTDDWYTDNPFLIASGRQIPLPENRLLISKSSRVCIPNPTVRDAMHDTNILSKQVYGAQHHEYVVQ